MSLQATHDHEDSVEVDGKTAIVQRKAGEKWLMKGEATIIPSIYQKVVIKPSPAIAIEQNEGIYILNLCTQEVRLVEGPRSIFLERMLMRSYGQRISLKLSVTPCLPTKGVCITFSTTIIISVCSFGSSSFLIHFLSILGVNYYVVPTSDQGNQIDVR